MFLNINFNAAEKKINGLLSALPKLQDSADLDPAVLCRTHDNKIAFDPHSIPMRSPLLDLNKRFAEIKKKRLNLSLISSY